MIILGIDPGARNLGWGVIHCGALGALGARSLIAYGSTELGPKRPRKKKTESGASWQRRRPGLVTLHEDSSAKAGMAYKQISELVEKYHPDEVALEAFVFFGPPGMSRGAHTFQVGQVTGQIRAALETCKLPVTEYTTRQVKHVITSGKKGAQKADVENYLRVLFRLPQKIRPSHAADAIAVAVCHAVKGALAMHVRAAIGGKR